MTTAANNCTAALGHAGNSLPFDLDQSSIKPTSNIKSEPMKMATRWSLIPRLIKIDIAIKNPRNIGIPASWGTENL